MPTYSPQTLLPWWADPKGTSVTDPLYATIARKVVGAGQALGGDDPTQSLMGVANPLTMVEGPPGGLIKTLMKYKTDPLGDASGKLMGLLNRFKSSTPDPSKVLASSKLGSSVPTPPRWGAMLSNVFSRVPEAKGLLETEMPNRPMKIGAGHQAQLSLQGKINNKFTQSAEDRLQTSILKGVYDRPAVRSFEELSDVAPSASMSPSRPSPPISQVASSGRQNSRAATALVKSGLSEDDVRFIRTAPLERVLEKFGKMNPNTLNSVRRRDSFSWIKD